MTAPRCKVLHITEGYTGGVATFLRHVLPAQISRGLHVSLICSPRNEEEGRRDIEELQRNGVHVYVVRMARSANPIRDLAAFRSILQIMRAGRYDIVHTHCFKAGLLGRMASRRLSGMATIHTPHCFPFQRCSNPFVAGMTRIAERHLARKTDSLMLVSPSQAQLARKADIMSRHGNVVIPNGIAIDENSHSNDTSALRQELGIPRDHLIVGTCCRLVAYKGIDQFIRCAYVLSRNNTRLKFVIAGDGPHHKTVEGLIRKLGLQRVTRMVGWRTDSPALVGLMDVLVLCSQSEGMPYVLLESMTRGTAIVASDVPGNNDLIVDGQDGLLYQYGNLDSLVGATRRCVEDRSLRDQLSTAAYRKVANAYRLEDQVDAIVGAYRAICPAAVASGGQCIRAESPAQAAEAAT